MDLKLRLWLPWTVMLVVGLATYGYYLYLDPESCGSFLGCRSSIVNADFPRIEEGNESTIPVNGERRIAVCLVGGARMFEITGRTLRKHLLDVYNNTDVFLHSPLDKDSHKFSHLRGGNLRAAKIFVPSVLPESRITNELITAWGSPHGMQGLLQYFNLVEGCYGMVKQYEVKHKFKYDWIIRTRVDGFWSSRLPEIGQLDPNYYYVAAGNDFHGLNDRFGMGSPHTSRAANMRLSLLPQMHKAGYRGLNSESAYKAQFQISGVAWKRIQIPFCIMTLRNEMYPPPPYGLLMLSMASEGPMSGTYCRPCDKEANATFSATIVDGCMRDWDWPGVEGNRVTVCDGRQPWAANWREIADNVYKRHLNSSEGIPNFQSRTVAECTREMQEFQSQWEIWDSPSPQSICQKSLSK